MKKRLLLLTAGMILLSSSAFAWGNPQIGNPQVARPATGTSSAPEIDPQALAGAMTMLSGGLLLLGDRRRRNQ